jgi:phospho-N-acetylmuramoyl-pentapeptide-transferase
MTIPLQAIIAFFVSLVLVLIFTPVVIPFLRKLKAGQQIIQNMGPTWHKSKQGTPTMGGLIFMFAVIISYFILAFEYYTASSSVPSAGIICLITSFVFAILGFSDDFLKIKQKNNAGLSELQKIIIQFIISLAFIIFNAVRTGGDTTIRFDFPFFVDKIGGFSIDLGIFWYVLAMIIMVGFTNAVNITDGLDGLCTSVTIPVAIFYVVISAARGCYDITVLSLALTGALLAFLIFNWHPCKIMMGDVGSMFLGGMVVTIAFSLDMPIVLLLVGIIYLIETFSVIIQRVYFKITHGKRLFKMTPIHHSFEMSGWSEEKICLLFSGITVIACIIAALLLI